MTNTATDDRAWIAHETTMVMRKVGQLTVEERDAILVPGSRSITQLMEHLVFYDGDCRNLHHAYHLGEISLLCKLALSLRK